MAPSSELKQPGELWKPDNSSITKPRGSISIDRSGYKIPDPEIVGYPEFSKEHSKMSISPPAPVTGPTINNGLNRGSIRESRRANAPVQSNAKPDPGFTDISGSGLNGANEHKYSSPPITQQPVASPASEIQSSTTSKDSSCSCFKYLCCCCYICCG